MKRSVLIMLMSVLILLTACRSDPPKLNDTFHASVAVSGGETDFCADVERTPDAVTVAITSPATVAGITYTYTKGELHTSCGTSESISTLDSLPPSGAPAVLCEALSRLNEAVCDESGKDTDAYRLTLDKGTVTITAEDGELLALKADYSPYTVAFTPRSSP